MPVNLQHLQHAVIATKTDQEHFQSPCAVSGIQNNFNPTRNSESARRNAPDFVHGGKIRDIKCKTGQPNVHLIADFNSILPVYHFSEITVPITHYFSPGITPTYSKGDRAFLDMIAVWIPSSRTPSSLHMASSLLLTIFVNKLGLPLIRNISHEP